MAAMFLPLYFNFAVVFHALYNTKRALCIKVTIAGLNTMLFLHVTVLLFINIVFSKITYKKIYNIYQILPVISVSFISCY